ncbi:homeobox protein 2-like isoform X2 [Condylostylus longicornis]|uniref:homeobox protein 2-like isoform X2 n=1 Tax=Condylostylus longicornis TaxID=2530218 RepID=UPI00244E4C39|nr:homeobox protein 2-like isoform X2 [Condylostylus longicornis]
MGGYGGYQTHTSIISATAQKYLQKFRNENNNNLNKTNIKNFNNNSGSNNNNNNNNNKTENYNKNTKKFHRKSKYLKEINQLKRANRHLLNNFGNNEYKKLFFTTSKRRKIVATNRTTNISQYNTNHKCSNHNRNNSANIKTFRKRKRNRKYMSKITTTTNMQLTTPIGYVSFSLSTQGEEEKKENNFTEFEIIKKLSKKRKSKNKFNNNDDCIKSRTFSVTLPIYCSSNSLLFDFYFFNEFYADDDTYANANEFKENFLYDINKLYFICDNYNNLAIIMSDHANTGNMPVKKRGHQHHLRFSGQRRSNVPVEEVLEVLRRGGTIELTTTAAPTSSISTEEITKTTTSSSSLSSSSTSSSSSSTTSTSSAASDNSLDTTINPTINNIEKVNDVNSTKTIDDRFKVEIGKTSGNVINNSNENTKNKTLNKSKINLDEKSSVNKEIEQDSASIKTKLMKDVNRNTLNDISNKTRPNKLLPDGQNNRDLKSITTEVEIIDLTRSTTPTSALPASPFDVKTNLDSPSSSVTNTSCQLLSPTSASCSSPTPTDDSSIADDTVLIKSSVIKTSKSSTKSKTKSSSKSVDNSNINNNNSNNNNGSSKRDKTSKDSNSKSDKKHKRRRDQNIINNSINQYSNNERAPGDGAPADPDIDNIENDPDAAEWAKMRCTSECTEIVAEREARRNKNRCADYPGLAFGRSIFSSDTMMKFNIIRNELHNIMKTQLKRVNFSINPIRHFFFLF